MAIEDYSLSIEFTSMDQDVAYDIGVKVAAAIQEVLSGPRSGRWYPVPGNPWYESATRKGVPASARAKNPWVKFIGTFNRNEIMGGAYQASAPGEPPAVRTGRLRQSFLVTINREQNEWKTTIRTNVKYADDLQFGGFNVQPRPFVDEAVKRAFPSIAELQLKSVKKRIMRGVE